MKTWNTITFTIIIISLCIAWPLKAEKAWWLTIRFEPQDETIMSIPVEQIHPTWEKATVLSKDLLPSEHLEYFETYPIVNGKRFNPQFRAEGDFNSDGIEDLILVGVYQTSDLKGNFVLILTKNQKGNWVKDHLLAWEGKPGFLVLFIRDNGFLLSDCLECEGMSNLTWKNNQYTWEHSYIEFNDEPVHR